MTMKLKDKTIAIIMPQYIGGGAEKVTNTIFGELVKSYGYSVQIICAKTNDVARHLGEQAGFQVSQVNIGQAEVTGSEAGEILLNALNETDAATIIYAGFTPYDPKKYRCVLAGRKLIFHLHTMPDWKAVSKLVGTREYLNVKAKIRREVKWYFSKYLREKWFKVFRRRFSKMYRPIYDNCDYFVVLTETYRRQMNHYLGIKENDCRSKVRVVYNPTNTTDLLPLATSPKRKEILYAGRLNCTEKGVDSLLRCWERLYRQYPDWELKIVGDGPDKGYLEYMARILGLKNYTFIPYSPDITRHLSTASILCLPSNIEGWGLVLIEAMAAGVVPIAFNCSGGVAELLADRRGVAVEPGNVRLLAKEMSLLMNKPEELSMRCELYPNYVKQFDVASAVESYLNLLR